MVTRQEKINLIFKALGAKGVDREIRKINAGITNMSRVTKKLGTTPTMFKAAGKQASFYTQQIKAMRGQMMGLGFSMLFGGMA